MKLNELGILEYYTKSRGVKGRVKAFPEDFVVKEVTPKRTVCTTDYSLNERLQDFLFRFRKPKKYVRATLVKKDYTTMKCAAKLNSILKTRVGYAGLKDKRAITAQRISVPSKSFKPVRRENFFLKNFEYNHNSVALGNLSGNVFEVVVRDSKRGIHDFFGELASNNFLLPNFFGEQRFGKNRNTHLVGIHLLKKQYDDACAQLLKSDGVFERRLKKNLSRGSIKALKKLGNRVLEFYIHAAQSYFFNLALSSTIISGEEVRKLELPGLESRLSSPVKKALSRTGIRTSDFKNSDLGVKVKGGERKCFMRVNDFRVLNEKPLTITFRLGKGCYASIVLKELCK